uniref:Mitochondrial Mme1 n=1 Tax=Starmerella bombicola TaxID=75736 RepID=A0A6M8Y3M3_STABO|nr:mitochondrial Mme1 [Starmerella bombicola]
MGESSFIAELHETHDPVLGHVLAAGGLGGALGDSLMYPLDTVKTRQQGADLRSVYQQYRTMAQATRTIYTQEGLRFGLYRGYAAMLAGSFPSTMMFFGTYETIKRSMRDRTSLNETLVHFISGFLGDLASSIVYVPSEVLKTRFQLQGPYNNKSYHSGYNYKGLTSAFRDIVAKEGWSALFHGYKATMLRDLPFSALQFAFYEQFRKTAQQQAHSRTISLPMELFVGAAAGGAAGVLTTPLDVIKTRIQTQTSEEIRGTLAGLRAIFVHEGALGLFSGVVPRFVWTSAQSSIMLVLYQAALRVLENA